VEKAGEVPQPPSPTPLARDDILRGIRSLLPDLERLGDRVRIVGTASSVLRGIDVPAGDVDILASERGVVDQLATAAAAAGGRCLSSPAWVENPGFRQYFASFELSGIRVEFSTVESESTMPEIGECTGDAPWRHFDVLDLEGHHVPVVASELRLLSEITRLRSDRWEPIAASLSRAGYDEELLAAAMQQLPPHLRVTMRDAVQKPSA
jgi:hypothetical protein